MLINTLRADAEAARRAKESDKATLLVTLLAEASRAGKDDGNRTSTDEEVKETARKFIKGINETLAVVKDEQVREKALAEKAWIEVYLPKSVSGQELADVVAQLVAGLPEKSPKQLGEVMKALKVRLDGAYDGKEARALIQTALQA